MTPEEQLFNDVKNLKEICEKSKADDAAHGRFNPVYTIFSAYLDEIIKKYEEATIPEC